VVEEGAETRLDVGFVATTGAAESRGMSVVVVCQSKVLETIEDNSGHETEAVFCCRLRIRHFRESGCFLAAEPQPVDELPRHTVIY